jgi:hypothetical protein
MNCHKCEKEYPSAYYFVTDTLCRECFERLPEDEQKRILAELESLSQGEAARRIIAGHELNCTVCGHDRFWRRQTLMNTPGLTFFGVEWANRQADNYVCDKCGHVLWFLREVAD